MNFTIEQEEHAKKLLCALIGEKNFDSSTQSDNIETLLYIIGLRDIEKAFSFQKTNSLLRDRIHYLEFRLRNTPDIEQTITL